MLICARVAWFVHCEQHENHSWLNGSRQSDGYFDPISRANFDKIHASRIILAAFNEGFLLS